MHKSSSKDLFEFQKLAKLQNFEQPRRHKSKRLTHGEQA